MENVIKGRQRVKGIVPGEFVSAFAAGAEEKCRAFAQKIEEAFEMQEVEKTAVVEESIATETKREKRKREKQEAKDAKFLDSTVKEIRADLIYKAFGLTEEKLEEGKARLQAIQDEQDAIVDKEFYDQHKEAAALLDKEKRYQGKINAIKNERRDRRGGNFMRAVITSSATTGVGVAAATAGLSAVLSALTGGAAGLGVAILTMAWQAHRSKKREKGNVSDALLDQDDYEKDLAKFIEKIKVIENKINDMMPDFKAKQKTMKPDVFKAYVVEKISSVFSELGISLGNANLSTSAKDMGVELDKKPEEQPKTKANESREAEEERQRESEMMAEENQLMGGK